MVRLNAASLGLKLPFQPSTAPATCLLSFYIGMMMAEGFDKLNRHVVLCGSLLILGIGVFVPLKGQTVTKEIIMGCAPLIVLFRLGEGICRSAWMRRIVSALSGLSYYIFLIHHAIIYRVLDGFDSTSTVRGLVVLGAIIGSTIVLAKVLQVVMNSVFQSGMMKKLDQRVMRRTQKQQNTLEASQGRL